MAGKQARCSRCKEVFTIPVAGLFTRPNPTPAAPAVPAPSRPVPVPPPFVPRPAAPHAYQQAPTLPQPGQAEEDDGFQLAPLEAAVNTARLFSPPPPPAIAGTQEIVSIDARGNVRRKKSDDWTPPATRGRWRDHTHWFLLLALIPLIADTVVQIASGGEDPSIVREVDISEEGEEMRVRFTSPNAFLPSNTRLHWVFALASAAIFATALALFNDDRKLQTWMLLGIGLATGTGGIFLLLVFQFLAFTAPLYFGFRVRGIIGLILLILLLIGLSYRCALDPEMSFIPSFLGFVFGVGLCEELVKAIPIVIYLKNAEYSRWRVAMLVGLASGVGFGVSEGVMYSGDYYNGLAGPSIYVVRFLSCVALHATWAGSVGLLMHTDSDTLFEDFDFATAGMFIVKYLSIAMVLHGLYDVLLKMEAPWAALLVAIASFGWLAFLVHRSEKLEWNAGAGYRPA